MGAAGGAFTAIFGFLGKLMRNKWFWIILAILIVLLIIRRKSEVWKDKLAPVSGDFQSGGISEGRKKELETLAQNVYDEINGGWVTNYMYDLLPINDNELTYLAKHYKKYLSRNESLYTQIDNEWMWGMDIDEKIMTRLNLLGLKS